LLNVHFCYGESQQVDAFSITHEIVAKAPNELLATDMLMHHIALFAV